MCLLKLKAKNVKQLKINSHGKKSKAFHNKHFNGWSVCLVVGRPGFNFLAKSGQMTKKLGIYSFPARIKGQCGDPVNKFAFGNLGQGT